MSDHIARAALSRMNLREVAVAPHYSGLLSDFKQMAGAQADDEQKKLELRRAELCAAYGLDGPVQDKPFAFASGVAIIPITGTLVNRFGSSYGYVTGYNFLRAQVAAAGIDPDVLGIVFDVNSYGGEAAGCFEAAGDLRLLANGKPIMAMIDSNCYSAAYALTSAANKIVCTPSGGAGSIGVVAMHVDMSKMLKDWGIEITFIFAGEHKVDGNPYEKLPASVKANIQKSVDSTNDVFVALVAKNRGIEEQAVRDMQAQVYRAEEAKSLGLIDDIATPSVAVLSFLDELSGSNTQPVKEQAMSTKDDTKPGAAAEQTPAQAATAARLAERARIAGITGSEEAKGREALADHLAMKTEMNVEEAKAILAASPKQEAPKAAAPVATSNPFAAAMDATGNPKVGATDAGAEGGEQQSAAAAILASQELATGRKLVAVK